MDFWLGAPRPVLRERILPMGEMGASIKQQNSGFSTRLEEKIVGELSGIRDILTEMLTGIGS